MREPYWRRSGFAAQGNGWASENPRKIGGSLFSGSPRVLYNETPAQSGGFVVQKRACCKINVRNHSFWNVGCFKICLIESDNLIVRFAKLF